MYRLARSILATVSLAVAAAVIPAESVPHPIKQPPPAKLLCGRIMPGYYQCPMV